MININFEINVIPTWPADCFIIDVLVGNQAPIFTITDTKLCVPVVNLSTQDAKLFQIDSTVKYSTWTKSIFRLLNWS